LGELPVDGMLRKLRPALATHEFTTSSDIRANSGRSMSIFMKRSRRSIAAAVVAVTLIMPALPAFADFVDGGLGYFAYGSSPKSLTERYVWSRFEHETKNHGSSAYGDVNGLVRSTCKAPGVRAYAESVYSIVGGDRTSYYRYC
jgi:hypothetical protein